MRLTREWNVRCNGLGGGTLIMMGFKERTYAPHVAVSLEELVPQDHFYRHAQQVLDLSFVYDLVRECYSMGGRPSIDPVVFFKLQLVMFFEDTRSERLLMRQVADRLSVRWYVGYDFDEPLPDHSTLSKIRLRYGLEVFRRFFEAIVKQCQQAKLVWGRELWPERKQSSRSDDGGAPQIPPLHLDDTSTSLHEDQQDVIPTLLHATTFEDVRVIVITLCSITGAA